MSVDIADIELIHENVFVIKKFELKYVFGFPELQGHILRQYNQHNSFIEANNLIHKLECHEIATTAMCHTEKGHINMIVKGILIKSENRL